MQLPTSKCKKLSIIVISYNTKKKTIACLHSIFKETKTTTFEVIVLDNDSKDESALAIQQTFGDQLKLIALETNIGFARGNNAAAQYATGDYLLLLNPDTLVLDGAIDKIIAFAETTPDHDIWGGRTLFSDMSLNPASCWMQQTIWSLTSQILGLSSLFRKLTLFNPEGIGGWNREGCRAVDIVSGCFFLTRHDLWKKLNGFHPDFFMYGEESDFCLRAKKLGAQPIVTSHSTIIHLGGASEKIQANKMVRLLKAKGLLINRHFSPFTKKLGLKLLTYWPFTRFIFHSIASLMGRDLSFERKKLWQTVWSRRAEWLPSNRDLYLEKESTSSALNTSKISILAIASAGGHWVQLMRLRPAWKKLKVTYVTTSQNRCHQLSLESKAKGAIPPPCYTVVEASRWEKTKLIKLLFQILFILIKERPTVIISTGAAPGFFALQLGKWLGARTVWVDSMANAETISLSGKKVSRYADLWLTQWKHLAEDGISKEKRPQYKGSVI